MLIPDPGCSSRILEGRGRTTERILERWCGVAQLVARRLAVRQARVRFSARHHREVFPTELTSDEKKVREDKMSDLCTG